MLFPVVAWCQSSDSRISLRVRKWSKDHNQIKPLCGVVILCNQPKAEGQRAPLPTTEGWPRSKAPPIFFTAPPESSARRSYSSPPQSAPLAAAGRRVCLPSIQWSLCQKGPYRLPLSQRHWLLQGEECTVPLQRWQCDFVTLRGSIHRGVSQRPKRDWGIGIQGYSRILWDVKKPLIWKGEPHEAPRALHKFPNFILIVLLPHAGDLGKVWRPATSDRPPFSVKEV